MAKILILIGGHLCTAPRPQKEADTLAAAGHQVTVAGIWFDPMLVERDRTLMKDKPWRFQPVLDLQPTGLQPRWQRWGVRLQARLARTWFRHLEHFSPALLGYGAKAMLALALQEQADLTIVHSEAGLWVGNQLLDRGLRVGVDFEDWFAEDLLPAARLNRPIAQLQTLEQRLACECTYCLAPSQAMARALSQTYQVTQPTVIYNVFPWSERAQMDRQQRDRRQRDCPSLHWFSQTLGPGRGLELLFQALPYLQIPVEIHLRGDYPEPSRRWLEPLVPPEWRDRLFIHPTVPPTELLSRIAEHDIGLALEQPDCTSRHLTVTNKLFQYLQAGLPVIGTRTLGQTEILSQLPSCSRLVSPSNPQELAAAITELLADPERLAIAKATALLAAETRFCWETQSRSLLQAVNRALQAQPGSVPTAAALNWQPST